MEAALMRIPSTGKLRMLEAALFMAGLAAVPVCVQSAQSPSQSKPASSAPAHWGWFEPKAAPTPQKAGAPATQKPGKPSTTTTMGGGTSAGQSPVTTTVTKTPGGADVQTVTVPGINGGSRSLVDQVTETTRLNANTTRTTTKIYGQDADGNRQLIGIKQTDTTDLGDGKSRSVTNDSQLDNNGQMNVTRREVSETVPTGPNSETTNVSVFTAAGQASGQLALSQKMREVKRKTKDGEHTVSTLSRPDENGSWATTQKTETTTTKGAGGATTEQKNLYEINADGKLSLSQSVITHDWKAKDGQEHQTVSTYMNPPGATLNGGGLQLMQQVSTVKTVKPDGTIVTHQQTAERSLVSPSQGLQVTGAVVETATPTKSGMMRTQQTVYGADGNGQLQQITVFGGEQPAPAAENSKSPTKEKEEKSEEKKAPATKQPAKPAGQHP
jgi:hypothetical protein